MNGFLGIDLGSTTTKAILLREDGAVLGRGLTNTRANFETAASIARAEALADARYEVIGRKLQEEPATAETARATVEALKREHRRAERRHRLDRLRRRTMDLGAEKADAGPVLEALGMLFSYLDKATDEGPEEALFGEALHAEAAAAAEVASSRTRAAYEAIMGIFERALVADEADPTVVDPAAVVAQVAASAEGHAAARTALERGLAEPVTVITQAGTGYGRHRLPFAKEEIRSEILCHGLGAKSGFPATRTILDIGGQDTKAIQLDEQGLVTSFQMNDRCAAGCGRYLGYVADELGLKLSELGPMAMASTRAARINSTCTVFAGTEIRERLALGEIREDVVAGLHRAIVVRALSLLARSGGVKNELTFSGGVGRNPAVVRFLRELVTEHYGPTVINVSPDSIYNGAIGAALFARMDARVAAC